MRAAASPNNSEMPSAAAKPSASVVLVFGEDEFAVKQRAKQLYQQWTAELGGMDHEILEAAANNSGEALRVLARLREALQTLPFFGSGKVVWLQNCNFLADERTASAQEVTATLAEISQELKEFSWQGVRLLVSAGKVDKRKVFYKTIDKLGAVESFAGWSGDDSKWTKEAELWARKALRARHKEIDEDALAELISRIGPNARQLDGEIEKLSLYVGERTAISLADVTAVCTRNKTARAFALGDALGDRNLPVLLRRLDEELWSMNFDSKKSEIGLLYGLITKVRAMIFLKEMMCEGWIRAGSDYGSFQRQLERVPAEHLPADKRFNPLAFNAYVLFKALPQAKNYTQAELIAAMDLLLRCNQRLVTSGLDEAMVLQQALVQIASREPARAA
jgi:DNA polymerase III subunit delta